MHSHTNTKQTWPIRLHRRPAFPWMPSTKHRFHRSRTLPLPLHYRGFIIIFCPFPHRITTLIACTTHHHGATQIRFHNYSQFMDTDHQPSHNRNHLKTNSPIAAPSFVTVISLQDTNVCLTMFCWPRTVMSGHDEDAC